jgi:hypothetical protein
MRIVLTNLCGRSAKRRLRSELHLKDRAGPGDPILTDRIMFGPLIEMFWGVHIDKFVTSVKWESISRVPVVEVRRRWLSAWAGETRVGTVRLGVDVDVFRDRDRDVSHTVVVSRRVGLLRICSWDKEIRLPSSRRSTHWWWSP